MEKIQRFVSAALFIVFAVVLGILAVAQAEAGYIFPALGAGAIALGFAIAAAFTISHYEKRAQHAAAAIFTAGVVVIAIIIGEIVAPTKGWLGVVVFGAMAWAFGLFVVYGKLFAKEPRPSRYLQP